jgi:hypothetical protein
VLPITTVRPIIYLVNITVQFPGWGGYFFVFLLPLEPIAYPRPNEVKQRLSTAIKKTGSQRLPVLDERKVKL